MRLCLAFLLLFFSLSSSAQDTLYLNELGLHSPKEEAIQYQLRMETDSGIWIQEYYYPSHVLAMQGLFTSWDPPVRNGYFIWYFPSGLMEHSGSYAADQMDGPHRYYRKNGKLQAIETYNQGVLDGAYEEYFANGDPWILSGFKKGLQSGFTQYFYRNGNIQSEGHLVAGEQDGEWRFYDEEGILIGVEEIKTVYEISEAGISIRIPNLEWAFSEKITSPWMQYLFTRNPIADSSGRSSSPTLQITVEGVSQHQGTLESYFETKVKELAQTNVSLVAAPETLQVGGKEMILLRGKYSYRNIARVVYIGLLLGKSGAAVEVKLDALESLAEAVFPEFNQALQSIMRQE